MNLQEHGFYIIKNDFLLLLINQIFLFKKMVGLFIFV
ncbi:hypothetical protein FUSO4_02540 [Fusobacterium necrophorum DJ-1]|uniref:Uncharacterized protein n=1 Tax=Fusobacterium necrophorum DJ-2 TaxID=1441737 RepID=A0AB73C2N7_9FUSO|nr:hypothetical protein FUSO5_12200 [Fusobacterium necrophorum BFTR-1]KDE67651.1 hypothetical protein FUSO4_02540 [Fusobacterium necrophorum DJ-1]KDE71783.1 hypothetical protein FUSO8_07570 [Fusobacterium necrophorum DJ-2]